MALSSVQTIRVGHSPDPDDAFMFYAMAKGKLPDNGLRFEHILKDIETLNQWAMEGRLEVTAVSVHAYAHVASRYAILPYGISMGDQYGPIIVAKGPMSVKQLAGLRIAIPGALTTAALLLRLAVNRSTPVIVPFDQIMDAVLSGQVDAGVLIHEGQLTHAFLGLHKILDLGVWWYEQTRLPVPLGINVVRKDLGEPTMRVIARILKQSIEYGMANRAEALAYAGQYGRGLDTALTDRFVKMYVNEHSMHLGEDGRRSVQEMLNRAKQVGTIQTFVTSEWVEEA